MGDYSARPWLARYPDRMPADIEAEHTDMLGVFEALVRRAPHAPALHYFADTLTVAELDSRSDALAVALTDKGFGPGDRLGLYLQNDPAYVLGLLAAWKAGGTAVAINPMNKARELALLLADSGAVALLCLDELYAAVAADVLAGGGTAVHTVVTTPAPTRARTEPPPGVADLDALVDAYAGRVPEPVTPTGGDVAVITYTSGSTGLPKGAMNTHANLAFAAQTYRDWVRITSADVILGISPLFHITGLVAHVGLALSAGCPLVLHHRFEPGAVVEAVRRHRPTFTIGAITVFLNLMEDSGMRPEDWASFRAVYSGGAPVAPAVAARFLDRTGLAIHTVYGLTETTSPSHAMPLDQPVGVDPRTGARPVGVPTFNTVCRVLDDDGREVPVGEHGELAISGPQVVPGYWRNPAATAESLPGGELRTGDVGYMDADGWFYVVERKKDMINASGYKVWPREVEDVLYTHPAVREGAVVGVPDEYRGETVVACVVLRPGTTVGEAELIAYCKERMAAYKYPRSVVFLDELPKTASGKILRRLLRLGTE